MILKAVRHNFIAESNKIEGIHRSPTEAEHAEFDRFMALDVVTVNELEAFVRVYQSNAILRDKVGLDVIVGGHRPPRGGGEIRYHLAAILNNLSDPFLDHLNYETLHPFTDGNGRSGRMLWAWQMRDQPHAIARGFLHSFYYQTLGSRRPK